MNDTDAHLSTLDQERFEKPSIDDVVLALRELDPAPERAVSATVVYGLSDLSASERRALEAAWRQLPSLSRRRVLRALIEASEAMFEMNYREIALRALDDVDSLVRTAAIELLWTDETVETMHRLRSMTRTR